MFPKPGQVFLFPKPSEVFFPLNLTKIFFSLPKPIKYVCYLCCPVIWCIPFLWWGWYIMCLSVYVTGQKPSQRFRGMQKYSFIFPLSWSDLTQLSAPLKHDTKRNQRDTRRHELFIITATVLTKPHMTPVRAQESDASSALSSKASCFTGFHICSQAKLSGDFVKFGTISVTLTRRERSHRRCLFSLSAVTLGFTETPQAELALVRPAWWID